MSRPETRHDFDPYDGEPGKAWDDFDERLLNFTSGKTDDRGYSIADTLLEQDEGDTSINTVHVHYKYNLPPAR